ncbi:Dbl homology domain-containing protein, partial [Roridomyces roridus]
TVFQRCAHLLDRLKQIRGLAKYFALCAPDAVQDGPIAHLQELFCLGFPLCYLFNLLPEDQGFSPIMRFDFDAEKYENNPDRQKTHAIVLFAMQIRGTVVKEKIPACELFTVTDVWNRGSIDGFLKVVKTVEEIVNYLAPDNFVSEYSGSDDDATRRLTAKQENYRYNIVREIVETERKYVKDIESMRVRSFSLYNSSISEEEIARSLFPNIHDLFDFQSRFLASFERIAELPWQDQRWGQHFIDFERDFGEVYAVYSANFAAAAELVKTPQVQKSLEPFNHLINVKWGISAFIVKPVSRGCKYPLLIDSLLKVLPSGVYQYRDELKQGLEAAKRAADKMHEASRRAENQQTVKSLHTRVVDWKGHNIDDFGELLLHDDFVVERHGVEREYVVYLFEKIILLCKEEHDAGRTSHSLLRKPPKKGPLLLKGRIHLSRFIQAVPSSEPDPSSTFLRYSLTVCWEGDEAGDPDDSFTLRCRQEYQMNRWEEQIDRLIRRFAQR